MRLPRGLTDCSGQSTVEYALVAVALLALLLGLGALWRFLQDGSLVTHAIMAASHCVQLTIPGSIGDVFLF